MLNVNQLLVVLMTFVVLGGRSAAQLSGKCGECLANGIACVDEEHFATCFENAATTNRIPCPLGNVCTAEPQICLPATEGYTAACRADACGSCTVTANRFACLDETRYGFCYTDSQPNADTIRDCPSGYVCNINSLQICQSAQSAIPSCLNTIGTTTSVDPSISTTDITTDSTVTTTVTSPIIDSTPSSTESSTNSRTTTRAPRDPNTLCADIGQQGNFKPDADTTCKKYIKCTVISGQFVGWEYTCTLGYFSETIADCQSEKPATC